MKYKPRTRESSEPKTLSLSISLLACISAARGLGREALFICLFGFYLSCPVMNGGVKLWHQGLESHSEHNQVGRCSIHPAHTAPSILHTLPLLSDC